jgi:hypothetical protein
MLCRNRVIFAGKSGYRLSGGVIGARRGHGSGGRRYTIPGVGHPDANPPLFPLTFFLNLQIVFAKMLPQLNYLPGNDADSREKKLIFPL